MCAAQHTYHAWHTFLSYPNCIAVRLPVRISALVRLIQFRHCSKCCYIGYDSDICLLGFCFGVFFTWIMSKRWHVILKKNCFCHCWFTEETTSYSNSHVGQWANNSWYCTCDDAYTLIVNNSRESGSVSSFNYLGAIIPADQNSRRNQSKDWTGYSIWKKIMM